MCAAPEMVRGIAASTASVVFESLPFLVAAELLGGFVCNRARWLLAYAGCGCAGGPGARSVPAAVATAFLFGPWVSLARFAAAEGIARLQTQACHEHRASLASELMRLAPSALIAACVLYFAPLVRIETLPFVLQMCAGLALGFLAAPCALGAVPIAGALRAHAPAAAAAFLCVAGIVDVRAWRARATAASGHDAPAYALLAGAAFAVCARHGAALVHPRLAYALGAASIALAFLAYVNRRAASPLVRWIPAALIFVLIAGGPQPAYNATETTLADAFAGERIDFTGEFVRTRGTNAIVRYAITCCRADAQPIALALAGSPQVANRTWVRANGTLREIGGALMLVPDRISAVTPPMDPFVYR